MNAIQLLRTRRRIYPHGREQPTIKFALSLIFFFFLINKNVEVFECGVGRELIIISNFLFNV